MTAIEFKYTNKQRATGCVRWGFSILFMIAFSFILFNIGELWESHTLEIIFVILAAVFMIASYFLKMGGTESKANAQLTSNALIIGDSQRYPHSDLFLDVYRSEERSCFHVYNTDKSFTLYTNEEDALIQHLLKSEIHVDRFEIEIYDFARPATVMIKATSGRMLGFNLDTGEFSIFKEGDADSDKTLCKPSHFIQTPGYKIKRRK